jgi:hypothetical protein
VSSRALSMSCRNPNSKISVEISKTLETLGPKIQNALNFILKVNGDALRKVVQLGPSLSFNAHL